MRNPLLICNRTDDVASVHCMPNAGWVTLMELPVRTYNKVRNRAGRKEVVRLLKNALLNGGSDKGAYTLYFPRLGKKSRCAVHVK